jgi:hypothetical protein
MIVREFIELLKRQDPEAIMATDDAEYIDEIVATNTVDIEGEKILVVGPGVNSRMWIGHLADHTGKVVHKGHRRALNVK